MNALQRNEIFERLRAANPSPKTELEYTSAFQLLIAVLLSAHTTDKSVNRATRSFFPQYGTPQALLEWGEENLMEAIKGVGLYRNKAKNTIATCRLLIELHDSKVPDDQDALEALPGVGHKTANVVLNTAFGRPTIAVDTHIFRVSNRTGLAVGKNVRVVEQALAQNVPPEFIQHAHHWLLLHGRYTCVARKPKCGQCIIVDCCEYSDKTV